MTEGAAQKFDVKRAKEIAWALDDEENVAEGARILMTACQRIEALEKVAEAAERTWRQVAPIERRMLGERTLDNFVDLGDSLKAAGYLRALEGSPE